MLTPEEKLIAISQMLESRLQQVGYIKLSEAYEICKAKFLYSDVSYYFKCIMNRMKKQGLADDLYNGRWLIHKKHTPEHVRTMERYKHMPDDTPVKFKRPPAVYNNSGSPYGIADELHGKKIISR